MSITIMFMTNIKHEIKSESSILNLAPVLNSSLRLCSEIFQLWEKVCLVICKVGRVLNQVGNKRIPKRLEITSNVSPLDRAKPSQKPSLDLTECSGELNLLQNIPWIQLSHTLPSLYDTSCPLGWVSLAELGSSFASLTYFRPFPLSLVRFTI